MAKARKNNLKNKIISCILAMQILLTTALPVVVNAITIEFPVKLTINNSELLEEVENNSESESANVETEDNLGTEEYTKKITEIDWKKVSDEELTNSINATSNEELAVFLKSLSEDEIEEILKRETPLIFPRTVGTQTGETYVDENGETWPEVKFETTHERYFDYLMEIETDEYSLQQVDWDNTGYDGTGTGHFFLKIIGDGKTTSMKVTLTNVTKNTTLSNNCLAITRQQ